MRGTIAKRLRSVVPNLLGRTPKYVGQVHKKVITTPEGPRGRDALQVRLAPDEPRIRYKMLKKLYKRHAGYMNANWPDIRKQAAA